MNNNKSSNKLGLVGLLLKANQLIAQHNYLTAISIYEEIKVRFGENADLLSATAHCYAEAISYQQIDERLSETVVLLLEKAIQLEPNNPTFYLLLAEYYCYNQSNYHRTIDLLRKLLNVNPNYTDALIMAGYLADVPENVLPLNEAVDWLERAIELDPTPSTLLRLGQLYLKVGRREDAKKQWLKGLLSTNIDVETVNNIHRHLSNNKMLEENF